MKNELKQLRKRVAEMEVSEALWKGVEEALRASEERYRLLAENATDVIWTMDMNLRFNYVSPSVVHMLGYTAEETMARTLVKILTPSSLNTAKRIFTEVLTKMKSKKVNLHGFRTIELEHYCKNGNTIITETKVSLLKSAEGIAIGLLGVTRDITQRKKMEERLVQSHLLASLGKMTAGIAHEVNNPLGSILLYSELLIKNSTSEVVKKDLKVIHDEAKRAARVMTDLLTYSLGGGGSMELTDLRRVINKVLDMRLYAETVQNITVSCDLPERPLSVNGDPAQLTQVFMNIMLNAEEAIRESDGGRIMISAQVRDNWIKISISDDATGIAEENLNQIFYPFFTTKKVGDGTGLGLSTCYGIITSHGGLIHAENNDIGGATIIVELPFAGNYTY